MITIEQLLESVDLEFEPRWVTKDENGEIFIWVDRPEIEDYVWDAPFEIAAKGFGAIKLSEFADKDWQECIYEVPRKTTGKIGRFTLIDFDNVNNANGLRVSVLTASAFNKLNELVEAVNELKGAKNE